MEKKAVRTKKRIMDVAMHEFGRHGYNGASVNTICVNSGTSKGVLYYHYTGKSDLYLQCVRHCCDELTAFLESHDLLKADAESSIRNFFDLRERFFVSHPDMENVFFGSIMRPPQALEAGIKESRRSFSEFNILCFRKLLGLVKLRDGVSEERAVKHFLVLSEMYQGYFQQKAGRGDECENPQKAHENFGKDVLNLLLYGIAEGDGV